MLRFACCIAIIAIIWSFALVPWYQNFALVILLYLLTGGWKWLLLVSKTIKRDIFMIKVGIIIFYKARKAITKNKLLQDYFSDNVRKYPNKVAYISADTGKKITFQETQQLAFKIANIFHAAGFKKGDAVALLMENRLEYIPIWLGLSMIGVVTALINYNIRGDGLKHCITISKCKAVIFSEDMIEPIKEIECDLEADLYCYDQCSSNISNVKYIENLLESVTDLQPPTSKEISILDPVLYMYTSGTTGLPKAVGIRGPKLVSLMMFSDAIGVQDSDIFYNALPLYHVNGGLFGAYPILIGCTCVIKKNFSASRYMEECCKYNVTIINYIGEICRYILAQPKREFDHTNQIRQAMGNGLRASIWKEFQERFHITRIVEIYGSTEGNVGLVNMTGKVGAVGFNSIAFPFMNQARIIKVDKDTGEIIRGSNGLAIEVKPGEPGQIVAVIRNNPLLRFDGYLNKAATKKKIAYDVFRKGDSVFLSGDILVKDEEGYIYFQDRTGDTFRWRGENVSTNEVEGVISKTIQLVDVTVYGVEIPGEEGKGGMACIQDPDRKINIDELQKELQKALPKYAQPVFLRMSSTIDVTGTFKLQKNKLREEGFDPRVCSNDDFYYLNSIEKKYMPVDEDVYEQILNQCVRF